LKRRPLKLIALALVTLGLIAPPAFTHLQQSDSNADQVHTPPSGSPERKAILDALREDQKAAFPNQKIVYKVHHLKVHLGWAWLDVTPLNEKGEAVAEGGPNLLHLEKGSWKVMDLSKVPEDPNDPLGPEDASPGFIKNLRKVYPGVPLDVFPKHSK